MNEEKKHLIKLHERKKELLKQYKNIAEQIKSINEEIAEADYRIKMPAKSGQKKGE